MAASGVDGSAQPGQSSHQPRNSDAEHANRCIVVCCQRSTPEGTDRVLPRERRAALPVLATHAAVRRCAGVRAPARDRRRPDHLGAVAGAVDCRRARLGRQRGGDVPAGRGDAPAPADRGAVVDPGGGQGSPGLAPIVRRFVEQRPDTRRGALAVRRRHRVGHAAAQLRRAGAAVDRVRVRRGRAVRVARSGGARREQLVRHASRRAAAAVARGLVGRRS